MYRGVDRARARLHNDRAPAQINRILDVRGISVSISTVDRRDGFVVVDYHVLKASRSSWVLGVLLCVVFLARGV